MTDSTTGAFRFACPKCGNRLRAEASRAGTRCDCPQCGAAMRVPTPSESKSPPTALNRSGEGEQFGFPCAHCGTRLHALVRHVGEKIECPDCGVIATVPLPAPPKPKSQYATPFEDIEAYELEDPHAPPIAAPSAGEVAFSYPCFICDSLLPATMKQVGEILACHDCGHRQKITAPKPAAPPPGRPSAMDLDESESYAMHAPIEIPAAELFVEVGDTKEHVRRAREQGILRGDYERPPLPSHPFTTGIYSFPFARSVWTRTLVLSIFALVGFGVLYPVVQSTRGAGEIPMIVLMILLVLGMLVMGIGMVFASGQFLNIFSSTAGGNEEIDWPDAVFTDWILDLAYLAYSFSLSAAPAWFVVWALGLMGIPIPLAGLLVFCSGFLLHPVVFLTITGAASPLVPFAPDVWKGFALAKKYLTAFYVNLFLLDLAVAAVVVFMAVLTPGLIPFVIPCMGVLMAMIYFRLLGRLAWCCSDAVSVAEEAALEKEEEPPKDAIDRAHEAAIR